MTACCARMRHGLRDAPWKALGAVCVPGADARSAAQRRPQSDAVCLACAAKTRCRTRSAVRSAVKWHQRWSIGSGRKAGRQRVRVYPDGSMHASPGKRAAGRRFVARLPDPIRIDGWQQLSDDGPWGGRRTHAPFGAGLGGDLFTDASGEVAAASHLGALTLSTADLPV